MPEYTSTERQCDSFLGYYQINIDVINDIYSCSSQDEGIDFSFFMAHKDDFWPIYVILTVYNIATPAEDEAAAQQLKLLAQVESWEYASMCYYAP